MGQKQWTIWMKLALSEINNMSVKLPLFLFNVDGSPQASFINGHEIENNILILDMFENTKKYKNLVIGRERDKYSPQFIGLSQMGSSFLATLDVECRSNHTKANSVSKITLNMECNKLSWSGKSTDQVDRFKFNLSNANYSIN